MLSRKILVVVAPIALGIAGCNGTLPSAPSTPPSGISLPDVKPAASLPQFNREENEVQIADSFNDVDPSWVLGSLVHLETGKVRGLDNYLKSDAKPKVTPQSEIAFKDFVENSVAANASWLEFLKTQVNDKVRAEVAVTKTAKVTIDSGSIDKTALLKELRKIPANTRAKYGVIIGYIDYMLTASLFRDSGMEGGVSGYGAKIGGNWYSKYENTKAHHRIVAVWSPLPFVLDVVETGKNRDLVKATAEALSNKTLDIQPLTGAHAAIQLRNDGI